MTNTREIAGYLDEFLNIRAIPEDHSNNGLQVEASTTVNKAVFAIDASLQLFESAAAVNADFIFVHHGISWGAEPRRFTGTTGRRLELLFSHGISLYAAHLPLDAHPVVGHNALLADMIKLSQRRRFAEYDGALIGVAGVLDPPQTLSTLGAVFERELGCKATVFGGGDDVPACHAGVISGGGGMDGLSAAIDAGLDCLITGEMTHTMYHAAREAGLRFLQLGHYCSEKPGVLVVMKEIEKCFGIDCQFIDIPTEL